jgi:methyl-accepting chemotaxis protein-1 (serine sensor receptor)
VKLGKWTISRKLLFALSLCALAMIAIGAVGIQALRASNGALADIYNTNMLPVMNISRVIDLQNDWRTRLDLAVIKRDAAMASRLKTEWPAVKRSLEQAWSSYYPAFIASDVEAREAGRYAPLRQRYDAQVDEALGKLEHNDVAGAADLVDTGFAATAGELREVMGNLLKINADQVREHYDAAHERFSYVLALVGACLLGGLAVMAAIVVYLQRTIARPLRAAADVAGLITQGQLGHKLAVRGDDELGLLQHALQSMSDKLVEIVSAVRDNAVAVSGAAQQIARGNDDLSQRTQEQASSLEETAASMEEMTATVKQNADNASQADSLARGARDRAEQGGRVVQEAVAAMTQIDASSRRMADIVGLIDEIAFQTNLLALNAAVEAARAGEQGRGFAVVATEVRNLAQRSASAAKEIKGLIGEAGERVRIGSELVDRSGRALADIVDGVKKVTDIVAEIAAASQEQSAGITQVNNAVTQMDEATQQNAALVEEAAAAARAMQEQARELTRQVAFFRIEDEAGQAAGDAAKPRHDAAASATAAILAAAARTPIAPRAQPVAAGEWAEF